MAMFEKTMQCSPPMALHRRRAKETEARRPRRMRTAPAPTSDEAIRLLPEQMRQLQVQLERMSPPAGQKPKTKAESARGR